MDKKVGVLALLLSAMFGGCSSDESVINEGGENNGQEVGYVAVNIVQPKSAGSRAEETAPDGFEYGKDFENKASHALFFIFNEDGTAMHGNPQRISLSGGGRDNTHAVERVYEAVLVIDGEVDKSNTKQLVCILNAPEGLETGVTTLAGLISKFDKYDAHDPGSFIMSNSVYMNGDTKVLGTDILESKIHTSASAAKNDPVDIYVERVVAQIRADVARTDDGTSAFLNTNPKPTVDGVEKEFTIVLTGIEIANIPDKTYLFKNLDNLTWPSVEPFTTTWNTTLWNSPTYFRSYWETTSNDVTYTNKSYKEIAKENFDISEVKVGEKYILKEYIQPNTNLGQKTSILVTAQLQGTYEENGATVTKGADLAYIRGGYTTKDGALALVAQYVANQGYFKKTSADGVTPVVYSNLATGDFEWKNKIDDSSLSSLRSYEVLAQVKSGTTNIHKRTIVGGEAKYESASVEDVNNLLKGDDGLKYKARVYTDGKCYYFVNIDQSTVVGLADGKLEGVVRNHIYDLTLTKIGGVGVPVFDPADDIIPEQPNGDDLSFLAARVNVLDWKLVKQGIAFGESDTPSTGN